MARTYKDSGIPWIGEIPEGWIVCRIKNVASLFGRIGFRGYSSDDLNKEGIGAITLSPSNMKSMAMDYSSVTYLSWEKYLESPEIMIRNGDLLMVKTGSSYGKVSFVENLPQEATINPQILRIVPNDNSKYLGYYLQTSLFVDQVEIAVVGGTIPTISQEKINNMFVIVPPISEQQRIAEFLDRKCEEIDELIGLQGDFIEELKAYKQSLITETVTRGLNPNAKLKPSGIDWIGEIPEGWKETKILNLLSMPITDGPHETPNFYNEGIPFISADAVSDGYINFENKRGYISEEYYLECCKKYTPKKGDIYMIKSGASTGRTAIVETDRIFTIWSPLAVFRVNPNYLYERFLLYVLRSDGFQRQVENNWTYGTQQNIGMRALEKLVVSYPPLSEQQQIADYLDNKCSEIDSLIAIKQQKIEELKDYKKSIIYEYVTGKREIK